MLKVWVSLFVPFWVPFPLWVLFWGNLHHVLYHPLVKYHLLVLANYRLLVLFSVQLLVPFLVLFLANRLYHLL
ncbi:hypothetical protein CH426_25745, partial [Klebsiella aerogenes]